MPDPIELRTDGPHNPEYTKQVTRTLAEAVRVLNYATMPGDMWPGLEYPADAYDLIADLYLTTQRLPQLLGQVAGFLENLRGNPALADSYAGNVPGHASSAREAAAEAVEYLAEGATLADELTRVLRSGQNAVGGLYVKETVGSG